MAKARSAIVVAAFIGFLFPAISFGGNLTNPALSIPTGKGSIGLEYNSYSSVFKPNDAGWNEVAVDMSQIYLRGSYGLYAGNEVYLKLGMADASSDEAFADGSAFEDSSKFSSAVGVKQSYEVASKIRVGGALQYTFFSSYEDEKSYSYLGFPVTEKIKIKNPWELNAALAASYIGEGFAPYGGIIASWRGFDAEGSGSVGGLPFSASTKFKEKDLIGGLAGIEIFSGNLRGNIEAQLFKKTSIGANVSCLF